MDTSFVATKNVKHLLFEGWHITSVGEMIGSMVAVFVFAALYEGVKAYVAYHYNNPVSSCNEKEEEQCLVSDDHKVVGDRSERFSLKKHIIKAVIYVLNIVYAYLLMLVAMTYNVWLFLAVIFGYGFGYFFCQPLFQSFAAPQRREKLTSYGATNKHVYS